VISTDVIEFAQLIVYWLFFCVAMISGGMASRHYYWVSKHTRDDIPIYKFDPFMLSKQYITEAGWPSLRKLWWWSGGMVFCFTVCALTYPYQDDSASLRLDQGVVSPEMVPVCMAMMSGAAVLWNLRQVLRHIRDDIPTAAYRLGPFLLSKQYIAEAGWLSLRKFWWWFGVLVFCLVVIAFT